MKRITMLVIAVIVSVSTTIIAGEGGIGWRRSPSASITVEPSTIQPGESATVEWQTSNASEVTLNGEQVAFSGSLEVSPTSSTTYKVLAYGRRRVAADSAVLTVAADDPAPDPDPEPPPPTPDPPLPDPVDGFTLSAVGIGSAFNIDDALSAASRDHELGALLDSQNGGWLLIPDEVMQQPHPAVFDQWAKVLADSGKKAPAVIWHDQGKVLGIDEVAGKTKADILALAISRIPADDTQVVIRGQVRKLGLLPTPRGAEWKGPSVSAILKPLAAKDCPSVDLTSQCLFRKNQTGGTCVLNAFSSACEAAIHVSYGKKNALELSPYFLAYLTDGYNGTWASSAAKYVQQYGNLPFGAMRPYDRLPSGWKEKSANYKCLAVYGPPDRDPKGYLRAALNRGYVVVAALGVAGGFDTDSDGYISFARGGTSRVNHEILVTGWDRDKIRFKILNSWGKGWGQNGTAWLEDRFFDYDSDLWAVVGMTAAPDYEFHQPQQD